MILRRHLQIVTIAALAPALAYAREDASRNLKEVISQLAELRDQVSGFSKVSRDTGLGKQTTEAELSFARAQDAMSRGQWLTTIQECQRYLTLSQKPEPSAWMKAQYMLGRSYEERGQSSRAVRAYLRYLSTFVTATNAPYAELSEVLERLVLTATKSSEQTKVQLNQFISSLSAMNVPDDVSAELKYFTAVGGAKIGQKSLALSWLKEQGGSTGDLRPEQRARALNFKALLAMQEEKWGEAEAILQSLLSIDELKSSARDGARISLARVFLKQRKLNTALGIYESFKKESSVYRDAIFEKTFVYIRLNQGSLARQNAEEYLKSYPEHPDAIQIRNLQSWFEIHSGNFTAAREAIESTTKHLEDLKTQVSDELSGKTKLTYASAKKVHTTTNGIIPVPPELEKTLVMFEQLADLELRLEEVNGMALNLLYAISKADLDLYKPSFANRIDQLDNLMSRYEKLSTRHIEIETNRLNEALSALDRQRLKGSSTRRKLLFSQFSKLSRGAKRMVTWLRPAEQLAELARVWGRLETLETRQKQLTAKSSTKTEEESLNPVDDKNAADSVRKKMLETLTSIRREQVKNIVHQSRIKELSTVLEDFAALVTEDQIILASYEPQVAQTLDILDDTDSQMAWGQINTVTSLLLDAIKVLEQEASTDINTTLAQIDKITSAREKLSQDIAQLKDVLEDKAGAASAAILAHYDYNLNQRISRQNKWAADVDFIAYSQKSKEQDAQKRAYEVEVQVLSDNLFEIQQGGQKR